MGTETITDINSTTGHRLWIIKDLDPLRILRVFSAEEYEILIEEWQRGYLNTLYERVERLAAPRDKGRDIVCTLKSGGWSNFQCKHYDKKLSHTSVFTEIGKCCYYSFIGDYTIPKEYYFVSPCGVSVKVRDLLLNSRELKDELIKNWDKSCMNKIKTSPTKLEGKFKAFVEAFNFSIFKYISETEFIDQFKKTPHYYKRFGVLVKPRKIFSVAPARIEENELVYIKKILDAYSDHLKSNVDSVAKLHKYPKLEADFNRQRAYFYNAEFLNAYSREIFTSELQCFEKLKAEVYHSIIEEIEQDADDGFVRLRNVLKRAELITFSGSNPLSSEAQVMDKKGICHQLANEMDEVKWVK